MKVKEVISSVCALITCCNILPMPIASAEESSNLGLSSADISYSGSCGEDAYWSLDMESGVLSISGTGSMDDFNIPSYYANTDIPWYSLNGHIKNVTIEDGITTIGKRAFLEIYITDICISESVTSIGNLSFWGCEKLSDIYFSEGVKYIGDGAFYDCISLTQVVLPNSVTEVAGNAFFNCDNLTTVTIPSSVTTIGDHAFGYINNVKGEYLKVEGFTIYGVIGSEAERYAIDNDFNFIPIEEESPTVTTSDILKLKKYILGVSTDDTNLDFNHDDTINILDLNSALKKYLEDKDYIM